MKKGIRLSRTLLLVGFLVLLISMTFSHVHTVKAVDIIRIKSDVIVGWSGKDIDQPIVPRNELKRLNVTVEFSLGHGKGISEGAFNQLIEENKGTYARIDLEIVESPSWCSAVFKYPHIGLNFSEYSKSEMELFLIINEDAPAFTTGNLKIKAVFQGYPTAPMIQGVTKTYDLTFITAYFPSIDVDLPRVNTREINPMQTATFPVNIENLGNEETIVIANVTEVPDGWSATITNQVYLSENETKEIELTIRPSTELGYRDKQEIVKVTMIPARAYDMSNVGDEIELTFLIKTVGFATPGFEGVFVFSAFFIVLFIFYIKKMKR